jgi:DNA-binding NarL/FixJ family response regulator
MKRPAVRQWKDPSILTPQESQIWDMRQRGMTTAEIADAMDPALKVSTVRIMLRRIKERLCINQKESADVY